jgi:hypothetical protein
MQASKKTTLETRASNNANSADIDDSTCDID